MTCPSAGVAVSWISNSNQQRIQHLQIQVWDFCLSKVLFLSNDLSSILSSPPSLLVSVFPLLHSLPCSPTLTPCTSIYRNHIKRPLFLLIAVSKGMRVHIGRGSLWPRRRARHCHFRRENTNIQTIFKRNLVAFKFFACQIYMCNHMYPIYGFRIRWSMLK